MFGYKPINIINDQGINLLIFNQTCMK